MEHLSHPPTLSPISGGLSPSPPRTPQPASPSQPQNASSFQNLLPTVITLVGRILQDLEHHVLHLLKLNPGRRDALAAYLERLAGIAQPSNPGDLNRTLQRWIEGPRSAAQNQALNCYFEELALLLLGQSMLLKAWSDRGIRPWTEKDVGQLNWAFTQALKPHLPLDREGWQLTRQNLYSWYVPSTSLQREIFASLENKCLNDEGPDFLAGILRTARQFAPDWPEMRGYDPRFFQAIWDSVTHLGFDPAPDNGPLRRRKAVFSPTLRDGAVVRTGPAQLGWIGVDSSAFQLMVAELAQLWWGPSAPPLWATGSGLEIHSREQLSFGLGAPSPGPGQKTLSSIHMRISEMEACDFAFVCEEKTLRIQERGGDAAALRQQLETLPYFKKLRSPQTSLGVLQACVAVTKLRPGSGMLWAREEPLSEGDGMEALRFLLDRARLVCEWDFSQLEHSLPVKAPLFPRFVYLFSRDTDVQRRHSHRPTRISLHGQIRSHIEVPLLLKDAFASLHPTDGAASQPRHHWEAHVHLSPTAQSDWAERWPDPAQHGTVRKVETLRSQSVPLASLATVRPTPEPSPRMPNGWSIPTNLHGIWLRQETGVGGRRLVACDLPRPGHETKGTGFLVLTPDDSWAGPLAGYLETRLVQEWLEHKCERKGEKWVLKEQDIKWIPVPKVLIEALGAPLPGADSAAGPAFATPLPGEWERLASEALYEPAGLRAALERLDASEEARRIRAHLFIRTVRAVRSVKQSQARLLSMVETDGKIRWRELIEVLPRTELVPVTLHPMIRLTGSLPHHLPIGRWERVRFPTSGILLSTESGFNCHLGSEHATLIDMLWSQLDGLTHPTWSELTQYLRLPRKLDFAESTAQDILESHSAQMERLTLLSDVSQRCAEGLC